MSPVIGVIGPGQSATHGELTRAALVGRLLAEAGCVVVTGGLGGVMEASSRGAAEAGGLVVGLLPGTERAAGNPYLSLALPTGLGELRNGLIVRASDAVICVGGSWGTLSEIALAVRTGVAVVTLGGWQLPANGPIPADTPHEAVRLALGLASQRSPRALP